MSDTYVNESQEDFSNVPEPLRENEFQEDCNILHESSSDDPEVFFNPQPSTGYNVKELPNMNMYMPYIEGPVMDWTVNDNLNNRFLEWKLKCESILECELAMLP